MRHICVWTFSFLLLATHSSSAQNKKSSSMMDSIKPELVLQIGHGSSSAFTQVFSSDGRFLATGGTDSTVKIWETGTGRLIRTLIGHLSEVIAVEFNPDGSLLASSAFLRGSSGRVKPDIRIWNVTTGEEMKVFPQTTPMAALAFSPDSKTLAAAGRDNKVYLYSVTNGSLVRTLQYEPYQNLANRALVFSPDGRFLATALVPESGGKVYAPARVIVWETTTGSQFHRFKDFRTTESFSFSPDSQWFSIGDHRSIHLVGLGSPSDEEHSLTPVAPHLKPDFIWSVEKIDKTLKVSNVKTKSVATTLVGHTDYVNAFALSPDGKQLASSSRDSTVKLWQLETGKEVATLKASTPADLIHVAFSPDGRLVASCGGKQTFLWDVTKSELLKTFQGSQYVDSVAFSPDGRWLIMDNQFQHSYWDLRASKPATGAGRNVGQYSVSSDGRLKARASGTLSLTNIETNQTILDPKPDNISLRLVAATENNRQLITNDAVWDLGSNPSVRGFKTPSGDLFSKTKNLLFSGVGFGMVVVWDAATGQGKVSHSVSFEIQSMALDAKGERFVIGNRAIEHPAESHGYLVEVFDISEGSTVWNRGYFASAIFKYPETGMSGGLDPESTSVAISPDAKWVAACLDEGFGWRIHVWDLTTKGEVLRLDQRGSLLFSSDSKSLTISTGKQIVFIDSSSWKPTRTIPVSGILRLFGDGGLAYAIDGEMVRVIDTEKGTVVRTLQGHHGPVTDITSGTDGSWIATTGRDDTTRIWDAATGTELLQMVKMPDENEWVVATPDGMFDGTQKAIQKLVAWRFGGNETASPEIFFSEFYYPGLLNEIVAGNRPKAARSIASIDRRQPAVSVAANEKTTAARTANVTIEVAASPRDATHASDSGVRDVRLFRNGTLVKVWRGEVALDPGGKKVLQTSVPIVAGENRLTAYAFNRDNVKSADATFTVTGDSSLKRKGTAYVIAIGIDRYANEDYNLKFAVADVRSFAEEFRRQQAKLGITAETKIVTLLDQQATKAGILSAIEKIRAGVQPEDTVVVYFAGHGTATGSRFYLIPHDLGYTGSRTQLDQAALNLIFSRSISDVELEQIFEQVDANQILLVIDACNSGQALEAEEKRRGPMNSKGLAQLAYEKGMYVLTAAQGYQAALEAAELGHGYLTYSLVEEALKSPVADGTPKDGKITIREWLDYAALRVPQIHMVKVKESRLLMQLSEDQTSFQQPRVFYRREAEAQPFIIASW